MRRPPGSWPIVAVMLVAAATVAACGGPQSSPSGPRAPTTHGSPSSPHPPDSAAVPSVECIGSPLGYDGMDELLEQASLTVEGRITAQVATDTVSRSQVATSWSIWELEVTNPLGAEVPRVLTVVDVDRSGHDCTEESGTPVIAEGLDGVFLLATGDTDTALIHPDHGRTYYAVTILRSSADGLQDVRDLLDPIPSLEPYRQQIALDNERSTTSLRRSSGPTPPHGR